ncbi:hypothetical protein SAMN04488003_12343 [Loktanella fryxellensis]|uniref:Uncharacterized protein n=1 Tax=Loktanella fryxellensis TaxID=245187 RepID=A0A1H8I467_9RHOB|nr:hypothetical protein [Loktanella fryxellensis]SEN62905.1 hypothetical protein SAMN04488003_12343 [Loktanella fryxellensis]
MNPLWLLRASRWARNPPSARRVWLVLGVIAACLVLAGAEWLLGGGPQMDPVRAPRPFTAS